jgi:hypothetical protein
MPFKKIGPTNQNQLNKPMKAANPLAQVPPTSGMAKGGMAKNRLKKQPVDIVVPPASGMAKGGMAKGGMAKKGKTVL